MKQLIIPIPLNCQHQFANQFSTAIFIPKDFQTKLSVSNAKGKVNKQFISVFFTIPEDTPMNEIYNAVYNAYLIATKEIRIDIAKYYLTKQEAKLKMLKSI